MSNNKIKDKIMLQYGYKYKLIPLSGKFEPLYAKHLMDIGRLFRDYPSERFEVEHLENRK